MGEINFRPPSIDEGSLIKELVDQSGILDINSTYCYLLLCRDFSDTCVVAEQNGEIAGFLSAYQPPNSKKTLFIWQIAVSERKRKSGIAKAMLNHLMQRDFDPEIQFIETTISPSNTASQALFRSLAKELQGKINEQSFFEKEFFSENGHEPEHLFRIGPINHNLKGEPYK